jgi:hypothetical protein
MCVCHRYLSLQALWGLLLLLCSPMMVTAQQMDFEGMYKGQLSQSNRAIMYDMILKLYYETDSTLFGTSKIVKGDGKFVEFYVEGSYSGNRAAFLDLILMKEEGAASAWPWCFKSYQAQLSKQNNKWVLSGDWAYEGTSYVKGQYEEGVFNCQPGKFYLTKVKGGSIFSEDAAEKVRYFQGRLVEVQQLFEVVADSLDLYFIDDNQIDNDTITIFYNKDLLVKQHQLSHDSLHVRIPILPETENLLIVYANNTGLLPPNTAAMVFYIGEEKFQISVNSDQGKNAGVIFRRKKLKE